jgi:murein hydrolase activator
MQDFSATRRNSNGASTPSRRRPRKRNFALLALAWIIVTAAAPDASPLPRPRFSAPPPAPQGDGITDMSRAVPAQALNGQPTTADQYRRLQDQIGKDKPAYLSARQTSDRLARETLALQRKLVATAGRVQALESQAVSLGSEIVRLTAAYDRLSASFAHDRVVVTKLLAVLERLQHGMPPAMALRPDDVLAAARGAQLMGATLPKIYGEAAKVAKNIADLRKTRQSLVEKRAAATRNAAELARARVDLAKLLNAKQAEAVTSAGRTSDLKSKLDAAAGQAASLAMLLKRINALRIAPAAQGVVVVEAQSGGSVTAGSLAAPVVGRTEKGGIEGVGGASAPGMTFVTVSGAQVVAPADGEVRYAGPYHRNGQALILRMADGYDAVLVGLERLDVRVGDHVLAREPVGRMPDRGDRLTLYFELRRYERAVNPAPFVAAGPKKAG